MGCGSPMHWLLLSLFAVSGLRGEASKPVAADTFDGKLLAQAIFAETNRIRHEVHRKPFKPDARLDKAAAGHVLTLALTQTLAHQSPLASRETVEARIESAGLQPTVVRENLARMPVLEQANGSNRRPTYAELAGRIVQGWLDSPDHRDNLLSTDVTHVGVATRLVLVPVRTEAVFVVQVFCTPAPPRPEGLTEPPDNRGRGGGNPLRNAPMAQ
jgi:uncharacterized protein YkwD